MYDKCSEKDGIVENNFGKKENPPFFVACVEDNATMSLIRYFENHVSYFVQNQRKWTLLN